MRVNSSEKLFRCCIERRTKTAWVARFGVKGASVQQHRAVPVQPCRPGGLEGCTALGSQARISNQVRRKGCFPQEHQPLPPARPQGRIHVDDPMGHGIGLLGSIHDSGQHDPIRPPQRFAQVHNERTRVTSGPTGHRMPGLERHLSLVECHLFVEQHQDPTPLLDKFRFDRGGRPRLGHHYMGAQLILSTASHHFVAAGFDVGVLRRGTLIVGSVAEVPAPICGGRRLEDDR